MKDIKSKYESKKQEAKKDSLIYGTSIILPATLSALGITALTLGDFSFVENILIGGTATITGMQTVISTSNYYKNLKDSFKEFREYNKKDSEKYLEYPKKTLTKRK